MSDTRRGQTRGLVACAAGLVVIGAAIATVATLSGAGLPVGAAQGAVVVIQAAAGMIWWGMLRRRTVSLVELCGMGLAVGTISSTLCDIVAVSLFGISGGWLIPIVVLAVVAILRVRHLRWPTVLLDGTEALGLGLSAIAGLSILVAGWIRLPLPTDAIPVGMHPDMLFFETLSRGLPVFGPSESLLMSGTPIRYHWFSYGWAGALGEASSAPSFQVLTRTLPLVALIAASALAVAWARRLSSVRWVPSLAGLLVVLSAFVGAQYGVLLNTDSPSQQMSLVWLLALAIALFAYLRAEIGAWALVLLALLGSSCMGGKVSAGVIAAGGVAALMVASVVRREAWMRRALLGGIVVGLATAVTYLVVLSGVDVGGNIELGGLADKASSFQGLNPFGGMVGVTAGTVILAIATLPRLAGLWPVLQSPTSRWQPETVFTVATVGASIASLFVLSEGINDLWFLLSASGPACVVAATGVGAAAGGPMRTKRGWDTRIVAAGVSALVIAVLVLLARTAEPHVGVRVWGLPLMAWGAAGLVGYFLGRLVVRSDAPSRRGAVIALTVVSLTTMGILGRASSFSSGAVSEIATASADDGPHADVRGARGGRTAPAGINLPAAVITSRDQDVWAAADWLSDHAPVDAIVATNRPEALEVPALTGMRTYLSGVRYQVGLGDSSSSAEVPIRQRVSYALTSGPTGGVLAALCAADVSWIWLESPSATRNWEGSASLVYSNPTVALLRLTPAACPD